MSVDVNDVQVISSKVKLEAHYLDYHLCTRNMNYLPNVGMSAYKLNLPLAGESELSLVV